MEVRRARSLGNPYGAFYVLQENSTGQSNYNSLQASYRINGWHGITSIVNYVWSKSLDNSSDGEDFEPNAAQPNDSTNPQLEYGPSNFNLPNRFTWIFSYDLPKMGGSMQRLKNGWGTNSTVTLQSGQPFQLNYNFEDDYSGSGNGFDRPDVVGPIVYHPHTAAELSGHELVCDPMHNLSGGPSGAVRARRLTVCRERGTMATRGAIPCTALPTSNGIWRSIRLRRSPSV